MRILFDQGTPAPLRRHLVGHDVSTSYEIGWSELRNGELLRAAETRFDLLITTDRNFKHEQNLTGRKLAIVVLFTTSWLRIQRDVSRVIAAVDGINPSEYREIEFPK